MEFTRKHLPVSVYNEIMKLNHNDIIEDDFSMSSLCFVYPYTIKSNLIDTLKSFYSYTNNKIGTSYLLNVYRYDYNIKKTEVRTESKILRRNLSMSFNHLESVFIEYWHHLVDDYITTELDCSTSIEMDNFLYHTFRRTMKSCCTGFDSHKKTETVISEAIEHYNETELECLADLNIPSITTKARSLLSEKRKERNRIEWEFRRSIEIEAQKNREQIIENKIQKRKESQKAYQEKYRAEKNYTESLFKEFQDRQLFSEFQQTLTNTIP